MKRGHFRIAAKVATPYYILKVFLQAELIKQLRRR
ncbi:hypothetical protein MCEROE11_00820 [Candidatus Nanopelagicaceae bacterium]